MNTSHYIIEVDDMRDYPTVASFWNTAHRIIYMGDSSNGKPIYLRELVLERNKDEGSKRMINRQDSIDYTIEELDDWNEKYE